MGYNFPTEMNVQLRSLENIIIAEDGDGTDQIPAVSVPARNSSAEAVGMNDDDLDEARNNSSLETVSSSRQPVGMVHIIPYQVIEVNDINDVKLLHTKAPSEFSWKTPLAERNNIADYKVNTNQSTISSQDITNTIRSRYQAITKKLLSNNSERAVPKIDVVRRETRSSTSAKNAFSLNSTNEQDNIHSSPSIYDTECQRCKDSQDHIKKLEAELKKTKLSTQNLEWRLAHSQKTIKLLKRSLKRRESKIAELIDRKIEICEQEIKNQMNVGLVD